MRTTAPLNIAITSKAGTVDNSSWRAYYNDIDDLYNSVLKYMDPKHPTYGKVVPTNPTAGLVAYADGDSVNGWDPGSGAGVYAYVGSAWVKL